MKSITPWQISVLLLLTSLASLSCADETPQATQEPAAIKQENTAAYPGWTVAEIAILRAQWLGS